MDFLNKLISSFPASIQPWTLAVLSIFYLSYFAWKSHLSKGAKLKEVREEMEVLKLAIELEGVEKSPKLLKAKEAVVDRLAEEILQESEMAIKRKSLRIAMNRLRRQRVLAGIVTGIFVFLGERLATLQPNPPLIAFLCGFAILLTLLSCGTLLPLFTRYVYQVADDGVFQFLYGLIGTMAIAIISLEILKAILGLLKLFSMP